MGKKNRGNEYCDVCKKIHRKGKCTESIKKKISDLTPDAAMALLRRATAGMYLGRDRIGDDESFIESDVVKEDTENEAGGNSEENK